MKDQKIPFVLWYGKALHGLIHIYMGVYFNYNATNLNSIELHGRVHTRVVLKTKELHGQAHAQVYVCVSF